MSMSERELEEIEKWIDPEQKGLFHGGISTLLAEVRRSHTEAAELRERVGELEAALRLCDKVLSRIYASGVHAEDLSILALWEQVRAALPRQQETQEEEKP